MGTERAGQGEVDGLGGCTQRVQTAWPCFGSAVKGWEGLRNNLSCLVVVSVPDQTHPSTDRI